MSRQALQRVEVAHAIRRACAASATSGWVVVVCPDASEFHSCFQAGAGGMFPDDASFSGRTALLPSGTKVSVVPVSATPFAQPGTTFDVMFCGWGDDDAADNRRMQVWRSASRKVLR